jgi:hypothetical protein
MVSDRPYYGYGLFCNGYKDACTHVGTACFYSVALLGLMQHSCSLMPK